MAGRYQIQARKKSLLEVVGVFDGSHYKRQKAGDALVARLYQ